MIGTGLAILGAGILGAGASIYGASKAASAQEKATAAAAQTQREGLAFQKQVYDSQLANFDTTKNQLTPFVNNGVGANNLLASIYGLNGGQPDYSSFFKSPDYTFALKEGIGALDNSAAAKGSLLSGNQLRAVTEYGSGLATQNLSNYLARLSGMSGQGLQAGSYLGQIGATLGNASSANVGATSNNIANTQMAQGTAEASGILGVTKGFQSGLNSLSLYNQMSQSAYKPTNYLSSYGGGTGLSLTNTGGLY
jgi:hypothetical protein